MNNDDVILRELKREWGEITRNVSIEDLTTIKKGLTPHGWSETSPKLLAIRRVFRKMREVERRRNTGGVHGGGDAAI